MKAVSVDGSYPTVEVLAQRATVNYGHFTSMQVRNLGVKGFDLHLERLRAASKELHNADLDILRVHRYLKAALAGTENASARIDVFRNMTAGAPEHIMVTLSDPQPTPAKSVTLKSVSYQRPVPHIKHAGGFAQIYHQRRVQEAGFSDALLVGKHGEISETAVANLGFIRGGEIIWPATDALYGITWQLLTRIFAAHKIPSSRGPISLHGLSEFEAAFTTNSHGITPISRIDEVALAVENQMLDRVAALYESEPLQPLA